MHYSTIFQQAAIFAGLLLFAGHGALAAPLVLVEDGEARLPLVIAADASEENRRAAEALVDFVERMSGARLSIVSDSPPAGSGAIWVGPHPGQARAFRNVDLGFEHAEEILIHANGSNLLITGRDRFGDGKQMEFGTANAVYTFLQKYLGIRWFMPTPLWEDVPEKATITIEPLTYRFHPVFRERHFWGGADAPWKRFQRLELSSYPYRGGHAYTDWWERYSEDHPEWFAMNSRGERETPRRPKDVKLCVSNPEVAQQWLQNAEQAFNSDPTLLMVSASPNDGGGFCHCEPCRAMDHPDGPFAGADRYVQYWNTLARGLRERFPDREVYVGAYAYSAYRDAPKIHSLEPNIAIAYVGHFPLANDEVTQRERAAWSDWAAMATHMVFRPNLFHYSGGWVGLPTLSLQRTIDDFRFLADHQCVGLQVDTLPRSWATQGVQFYLMAQLAYDPYQDGNAVLQDFYQRGFGPAAATMADFFELMEDAHELVLTHIRHSGAFARAAVEFYQMAFDDERLAHADTILDRAATDLEGAPEVFHQRLQFIRDGVTFIRMQMDMTRIMARVRESEGRDVEAVRQAIALHQKREQFSRGRFVTYANWYRPRVVDYFGPPSETFLKAAGIEDAPSE